MDKCVYIFRMLGSDYYKIGVTQSVVERLAALRGANPVLIIHVWSSKRCHPRKARLIEHFIHDEYRHRRMHGASQREWFRLTDQDVKDVREKIETYMTARLVCSSVCTYTLEFDN